jgi:hypothetical protein
MSGFAAMAVSRRNSNRDKRFQVHCSRQECGSSRELHAEYNTIRRFANGQPVEACFVDFVAVPQIAIVRSSQEGLKVSAERPDAAIDADFVNT